MLLHFRLWVRKALGVNFLFCKMTNGRDAWCPRYVCIMCDSDGLKQMDGGHHKGMLVRMDLHGGMYACCGYTISQILGSGIILS